MKEKSNRSYKNYLLVLLIGICFSLWLMKSGTVSEESVLLILTRIKGLSESIQSGDIRAFIHCGLYGYGYAFGLFKSNLFLYIPSLLYINGVSLINAYKINTFLYIVASAFTMYWCLKHLTKSNTIAVLASFIYSGSVCKVFMNSLNIEVIVFAFLPLIILGLYNIIYENNKKWWVLLIGFTGLIECNIAISLLMLLVIFIIVLFNINKIIKDRKKIKCLIITLILSIMLSAHYLFPLIEALFQNNLNLNFEIDFSYSNHKLVLLLLSSLLFIFISLFRLKIKSQKDSLLNFCDISILIAYLTLILSIFFLSNYLFLLSSLFFVLADSIILYYLFKGKNIKKVIVWTIAIMIFASFPYIIFLTQYDSNFIYSYDDYYIGNGDYLPKSTSVSTLQFKGEMVLNNNYNMYIIFNKDSNFIEITYGNNLDKGTYIEVPLLYYYGYVATDEEGNNLNVTQGNNNVIRIYLEDETNTINIYYKGTTIQKISLFVSMFTLLGLVIFYFRSRKKRKKNYKEIIKKYFNKVKLKINNFLKLVKERIENMIKNAKKYILKKIAERKESKILEKELKKNKKNNKLIHIEFFRVIAIIFVMFNHMGGFTLYGYVTPHTFAYWFYMCLSILCKFAVPLFYMIAGAMLIKKQEELGTIYKKRVLKYFIILLGGSIFYAFYNYFAYGTEYTISTFLATFYYDNVTGAFWYLYSYLAILMGLPLINKMAKNMKMKEYIYLAVMSFLFIGLIPVFQYRVFLGEHTINWNIRSTLFISDALTYPLMGYFFEYVLPKKYYTWKNAVKGIILSAICIALTCYITDFYCIVNEINFTQEFHSCLISIPTYTIYFCGKLFFMKHKVSDKFKKIICYLGSLVFGVFLLENIVRPETQFVYDAVEPIIGALPANFVHIFVAYALGLVIVAILKKIPIIKNYI